MKKNILFFVLTIALFGMFNPKSDVFAQDNPSLYFSKHPHAGSYNPAFMSNHKFYLYALGRISLGFRTSGFDWNDLINETPGNSDSLRMDVNGFLNKLKENNNLSSDIGLDVAGIGFKIARNYFSLGVSLNLESKFKLPLSFVDFLFNGAESGNHNLAFNDNLFNAVAYTTAYAGYAREITDRLTVGIKFKMYNGILNIHTNKAVTSFATNSKNTLYGDVDIDMSFFFGKFNVVSSSPDQTDNLEFETEDDIVESLKKIKDNKGYGLDIGAVYRLNDNMEISASVIDFGKITWKTNAVKMYTRNPDRGVKFSGIDTDYEEIKDDIGGYFNNIGDSLKDAFDLTAEDIDKYTTNIPTKVYIGYSWQFVPHLYLQALYNARFISSDFESSLSLNLALMTNFFSLSVGNTIKYTMFNPNVMLSLGNVFLGASFSSFAPKKADGLSIYMGWSLGFKNKKKPLPLKINDNPDDGSELSFLEIK